jgi:glycosyltransferase involved in cell wall biosynthesis
VKLCFVTPGRRSVDVLKGDTSKSGGSEAQVALLAAAFVDLGHKVDLIYGDRGKVSSPLVIAGISCIDAFPSWGHPWSLPVFWSVLKKSAADLIYTRLPSDFLWIIGLFSKLHARSRFMYALCNDSQCNPWKSYRHKKLLHNPLYALGLRTADIVAVQHEGQVQLVRRFVNGKLVLVPNLVRLVATEVRNCRETDIDVIWIAQIRPQKQLSVLLGVAEELPHLQFAVVGGFVDTRSRSDLERRMVSLRNLSYLGPLDHEVVMRLLVRSRVLANTSYWEGFPNTMLEAWSLGVPVVSLQNDPGGVISREGLGLVSRTPGQMVRDIMKLVEERPLNCEMGKRGQEYVQRAHGIGAVCRAFEHIMPGFEAPNDAAREGIA